MVTKLEPGVENGSKVIATDAIEGAVEVSAERGNPPGRLLGLRLLDTANLPASARFAVN